MDEHTLSPQRAAYLQGRKRRQTAVILLRIGLLVVLFGAWELAARLGAIDAFIFSSPSRMWDTLKSLAASGDLVLHVGTSVWETVVGFVLGTLFAGKVV